MATVNSLVTKIRALLSKCNTYTGESDNTLSDAVDHVIAGASGTDVSDTTATADDVLANKDFYLASGTKTSGNIATLSEADISHGWDANVYTASIPKGYNPTAKTFTETLKTMLKASDDSAYSFSAGDRFYFDQSGYYVQNITNKTPSSSPQFLGQGNYHVSSSGYLSKNMQTITPSASGTAFSAGVTNLASSGYAYSEKPASGAEIIGILLELQYTSAQRTKYVDVAGDNSFTLSASSSSDSTVTLTANKTVSCKISFTDIPYGSTRHQITMKINGTTVINAVNDNSNNVFDVNLSAGQTITIYKGSTYGSCYCAFLYK